MVRPLQKKKYQLMNISLQGTPSQSMNNIKMAKPKQEWLN